MDGLGGRPHWGKRHFQTAATLRPRYAEWDRFQAVRARLDPDGRFANSWTDRVLGPVRSPSLDGLEHVVQPVHDDQPTRDSEPAQAGRATPRADD
jgi:D-arabinono-1,4-lactone oxidase